MGQSFGATRSELRVRRASKEDTELLWQWANDPQTRASAFNTDPIPWETHHRWFDGRILSADCAIWILTSGQGVPLGQIRYDRIGDGAEVDISIAPEHRGKGLAIPLIQMTLPLVRNVWSPNYVEAHVKETNTPSQKSFRRAGFLERESCPAHGPRCVLFMWEPVETKDLT
jgi:RimJ/RimL family protein N-acetyltransferase